MRFITFLGLALIAKSVDSARIAEITDVIMTILSIALIVDVIDCAKRWMKK